MEGVTRRSIGRIGSRGSITWGEPFRTDLPSEQVNRSLSIGGRICRILVIRVRRFSREVPSPACRPGS